MQKIRCRLRQILVLCMAVSLGMLYSCQSGTDPVTEQLAAEEDKQLPEDEAEESTDLEPDSEIWIFIYVCGEVHDPGVYELPADARIVDAIAAAGGMTDTAAVSFLNQAEAMSDGQKVYVPSREEAESYGQEIEGAGSTAESGQDQGLININTAGLEQLTQLPGIGETKAGNIIAYREQSGGFEKLEDILNVDGIGSGTYQKLKDFICI